MTESARSYPWRTFVVLVGACGLTSPLVIPYFLGLRAIATVPQPPVTMALGKLALAQILRNLALSAPAAGLGLLVARRLGLGAPYLAYRLDGAPRPVEPLGSIVGPALMWAAITALLAFGIDATFVRAGVLFPAPEIHARIQVVWWRSGLACFWAPFAEETFDRLFLLSLVAWVLVKLFRIRGSGRGRTIALWTANLATAVFFGWYHISNEQLFAQPVPMLVAARTILIVAPVGLAFGWLYIRRGIEAAILSHFAIDVIVHVVRPVIEGRTG